MRDFLGAGSFLASLACAGYGMYRLVLQFGPQSSVTWFSASVLMYILAGLLFKKEEKKGPRG